MKYLLTHHVQALVLTLGIAVGSTHFTPAPTLSNHIVSFQNVGVIQSVGVTGGRQPVYLETSKGLFRSANPDDTHFIFQGQSGHWIGVMSPNPNNPDDLMAEGTGRSVDGGRTFTRISRCDFNDLTRSVSDPNIIYGGTTIASNCPNITPSVNGMSILAKSRDDGLHWTTVFTAENGYDNSGGVGPIVISDNHPSDVYAVSTIDRGVGGLFSPGSGDYNSGFEDAPFGWSGPSLDIGKSDVLYVGLSYGLYVQAADGLRFVNPFGFPTTRATGADGKQYVTFTTPELVNQVTHDPLSSREYVVAEIQPTDSSPTQVEIYALNQFGFTDRFMPHASHLSPNVTLLRNGSLISWKNNFSDVKSTQQLLPIIAAGSWSRSTRLGSPVAKTLTSAMGLPISPTTTCTRLLCQYFEKGAVARSESGTVSAVPLVPTLFASISHLPVGGKDSTVTYAVLARTQSDRVLPQGFVSGTLPMAGGTFVPRSARLARAPGYIVPSYFWWYMTHESVDWMSSFGLPLTPATHAVVGTGHRRRVIMVQAFDRAVLTYDPQNSARFEVQRANIGSDFAKVFPGAVR